ncbi:uncharacterized protein KY384_001005 [Bacidia gigantensis]|uniref:uncharacterized protein n=1 Tax=Bacidia gigantensis TaxID=2732470 RepID=UPI001D05360C|nr:uncharacterized protein KY384_001005 [Bacidia gigantensis]KAG8534161.1 hypothetical protein KY384_001005 [Bacidia gigantensis]
MVQGGHCDPNEAQSGEQICTALGQREKMMGLVTDAMQLEDPPAIDWTDLPDPKALGVFQGWHESVAGRLCMRSVKQEVS